jgi:hypothetical protein
MLDNLILIIWLIGAATIGWFAMRLLILMGRAVLA